MSARKSPHWSKGYSGRQLFAALEWAWGFRAARNCPHVPRFWCLAPGPRRRGPRAVARFLMRSDQ